MISFSPKGSATTAATQYTQRSTVVMRYLATRALNHTMYSDVAQAHSMIITLPQTCECWCDDDAPVSTTATAPAMPSTSPETLSFVKRSMPSNTESSSTSSGTMVSMIDPSMGEVIESPYIMNTLRSTPISSAAPISLRMSARATRSAFCHSSGTSEKSAVTTSDPATMAIGWT